MRSELQKHSKSLCALWAFLRLLAESREGNPSENRENSYVLFSPKRFFPSKDQHRFQDPAFARYVGLSAKHWSSSWRKKKTFWFSLALKCFFIDLCFGIFGVYLLSVGFLSVPVVPGVSWLGSLKIFPCFTGPYEKKTPSGRGISALGDFFFLRLRPSYKPH